MYSNQGTIHSGYATTLPLYVVACSALGLKSRRSASVSGGSESWPAAALVPGGPAGAQATTPRAAAMAWRNRLREIVTSRSISMPPRIRSAPDYSRRLEEHDRDRPRGRRPVHLVPRVQADELRPQPLSFFARRVARAQASHPPAQAHLDVRVRSEVQVPRGRTV